MANPVQYAEDTLGVHKVWEEVQSRMAEHDRAVTTTVGVQTSLRSLHAKMTDREMHLASEGRAKYSELSATAFGPVLKAIIHDDSDHRSMREKELELQGELAIWEAEASRHKLGCRVLSARMEELGGLLHYFAAVKQQTQVN